MKRILALILLVATVLSFSACQNVPATQTTPATQTQTQTQQNETAPSKDKPAGTTTTVTTPMKWDTINSLPIATNDMSIADRRQLCSDFFRMAQTFQWTPNEEIRYTITASGKKPVFEVGKVYAGVPYITEAKSGSIYIAMEYYDEETGVLDVASVGGKNFAFVIGNHCSSGALWGWTRVVNSATCQLTHSMVQANGCLKLGPYQYDTSIKTWNGVNTDTVIKANGTQTIYESYALLDVADGIVRYVNSGHVCMISEKATVVRKADGTIDGDKSYVKLHEQGSSPVLQTMDDGSQATIVGRVDSEVSFKKLIDGGYVPFTFAEFQNDPVEKATVSSDIPEGTVKVEELMKCKVSSNYAIATLTATIYDADGKEIYKKIGHNDYYNKKEISIATAVILTSAKRFAKNPGCTIKLETRVSTGEVFPVYSGNLVTE